MVVVPIVMLGFVSSLVFARDWGRMYTRVTTLADEPVAEMTLIFAADSAQPLLTRSLYSDAVGTKLVIRASFNTQSQVSSTSYQCLTTGETLTIASTAAGSTVSLGAASYSFLEQDFGTAGVQQQGATLIATANPIFRDALRRLVSTGYKYVSLLQGDASLLRDLFFPDLVQSQQIVVKSYGLETTKPFDPTQKPPNSFESQFGSAYFE
jgi:hypothetical protein